MSKNAPPAGRAGQRQIRPTKAEVKRYVDELRTEAAAGSVEARVALIELSVKLLEAKRDGRP